MERLVMAVPATQFEAQRLVDRVDRIQSESSETRAYIHRIDRKVHAVEDSIDALRSEMKHRAFLADLNTDLVMTRVFQLVVAAVLIAALAHGFKWI
jgi:hypothetical protein